MKRHLFFLAAFSFSSLTFANPNLKLWLRADALALQDGESISTWADQSEYHNDATQNYDRRPTYAADSINHNPAAHFDGYSQMMRLPDNSVIDALLDVHMFAVVRQSDNWSYQTLFGAGYSGSNPQFGFYNGRPLLRHRDMEPSQFTTSDPIESRVPVILEYRKEKEKLRIGVNDIATEGNTTNSPGYAISAPTRTIGGYSYGGARSAFSGEISEIILYDTALPLNEKHTVLCYLSRKYSIKVSACE